MSKSIVIAVVSDVHCGSTLAMCPPEGVLLDDGGKYLPSAPQEWLWACWLNFWERVQRTHRAARADLWIVLNGDSFEGQHHGTTQVISNHPEPQSYLADRIFGVPRGLAPRRTFVVRGTEAHVGPAGATEEAFARSIRAEENPETRKWSWWHLRLRPHGCLLDFQHHPSTRGTTVDTRMAGVARLAGVVFKEHAKRGLPAPALAVRSHTHVTADSYDAWPVRAIITPAWQLKTAHALKVAADSIADIGGVVITVAPDGTYRVDRHLYPVLPPDPWTPT